MSLYLFLKTWLYCYECDGNVFCDDGSNYINGKYNDTTYAG